MYSGITKCDYKITILFCFFNKANLNLPNVHGLLQLSQGLYTYYNYAAIAENVSEHLFWMNELPLGQFTTQTIKQFSLLHILWLGFDLVTYLFIKFNAEKFGYF